MGIKNKFRKNKIWEKILEKKIFFGEKNVNNIFLILFLVHFVLHQEVPPIPPSEGAYYYLLSFPPFIPPIIIGGIFISFTICN